jgi:uncharacterized membrane protein YfcA
MNDFFVITGISFLVSIASGILGLGGAIILIPAYLYLPPLLGMHSLDIKTISGITSIQVLATSLIGTFAHNKSGNVNERLLYYIGLPMMLSALGGALFSNIIDGKYVILAFALMAITGAALMFVKIKDQPSFVFAEELVFNKQAALISAVIVGFFGGIVGAPGAFLLAPIMITILKIPVRTTIGSTLGIVLFTALTASIGKVMAGQVNFLLTFYAVSGSAPGVLLGSRISGRLEPKILRLSLAVIIIGIAIEMVFKVFY